MPTPWNQLSHLDKIEDLNTRLLVLSQHVDDEVAALNTRIDNLGPGATLPDVVDLGFDTADFANGATLLTIDLSVTQPATDAGFWIGVLRCFGAPTAVAPTWVGLEVDTGFGDIAIEGGPFIAGTPAFTLAFVVKVAKGDTVTFKLQTSGTNMTLNGEVRIRSSGTPSSRPRA